MRLLGFHFPFEVKVPLELIPLLIEFPFESKSIIPWRRDISVNKSKRDNISIDHLFEELGGNGELKLQLQSHPRPSWL